MYLKLIEFDLFFFENEKWFIQNVFGVVCTKHKMLNIIFLLFC